MKNETLNNLFNDVTGATLPEPTESHLVFVTEVDSEGKPEAYGVYGDVYDTESNEWFSVAEYMTNFNRAMMTMLYYSKCFDVANVKYEVKEYK
jgi:hypothetical protein